MRFFHPLYLLLLLLTVLVLISADKHGTKHDFLNLRRKYRRHNCPKKRCLPLHSRVPFP
ncbi:apelin receptor early endogenous ligand precursor [Danio rerio]|uniref:Apelin receptor early endogenous ligand n=1 Tax=Danio rerio TaxID=7955 RepID=ELA_DANRE|nr:apelin receptor early endogenous ligand precursor [Danio rerio]P0DMC2.1 RecName: Full=Apelin receptor early endogenous ligand; AltName: Full=Protein Elabela; Short=ELA; AltName: Full=Protein Toddler; Flags: Precursor [Danio rerio]|eukprot:NP_001284476.1 apelin receptor early endogenous ligand precursor [Danio rerio]